MRNNGFTFIELLITLVVLSICILPLLNMFAVALDQTRQVGDMTTARYLAQEGMERVKNLNYTVAQLEKAGDVWFPALDAQPLTIDDQQWRVLRKIVRNSEPLQVHIQVFKDRDLRADSRASPVVDIATLITDFDWAFQ